MISLMFPVLWDRLETGGPLSTYILSPEPGPIKCKCLLCNLLVTCSWHCPDWTVCECICICWNCMDIWGICASTHVS